MKKTAKKSNKRSKTKYPGLDKSVNTKKRWDLIDHDYLDKLNEEEKAWLNKFNVEYLGGNFKKNSEGKYAGNLHKTRSLKERNLEQ